MLKLVVRLTVLAALVLNLGASPATAPSNAFTDKDYADHIDRVRKLLGDDVKSFTILEQRPFVVIGDGAPASVRQSAKSTVEWAVTLLKKDYFSKEPADILDIYLFKDSASYEKYAASLFKDKPTTPYGYYSPRDKALVMNIATGGGTLVHEIVHPFIATNFPKCPSWFNEGLASLYEQAGERGGHIIGRTNWRLAGLQKAIAAGSLDSFEKLTATDSQTFYGDDRGTNYAQARYLCYYLQEHDLLHSYYKEFVANCDTDPTGYDTLIKVLGEKDMPAFQKSWEQWVAGLSFP